MAFMDNQPEIALFISSTIVLALVFQGDMIADPMSEARLDLYAQFGSWCSSWNVRCGRPMLNMGNLSFSTVLDCSKTEAMLKDCHADVFKLLYYAKENPFLKSNVSTECGTLPIADDLQHYQHLYEAPGVNSPVCINIASDFGRFVNQFAFYTKGCTFQRTGYVTMFSFIAVEFAVILLFYSPVLSYLLRLRTRKYFEWMCFLTSVGNTLATFGLNIYVYQYQQCFPLQAATFAFLYSFFFVCMVNSIIIGHVLWTRFREARKAKSATLKK